VRQNHQTDFRNAITITKDDSAAIPITDGIMVNVAGNVAMRLEEGNADVTLALLAGVVYRFRVKYVRSTSTTATGITGLYS
jgi:hypothetical protein